VLRVWCTDCLHRVDLDPGEQAERYGPDLPVPDWASRLPCSRYGSRQTIKSRRHAARCAHDHWTNAETGAAVRGLCVAAL
jgi:hypothetical protein